MHFQLSVIVPSYKRHEPLELCLEDLCAQEAADGASFEVVLVLQAYSAGAVERITRRFGDRLHLQIADFPEGLGTSRARNTGLEMARGDIVAFLDDDVTSNRYKIDWGGFNLGPANHPRDDQPAAWLSGGNMSFRREAIQSVGGFDEALGSFWHEDVDVTHRVAKSGWKIISSRKLAIEHYPSTINRPPLHAQVRERERSRVLFVWKAIGDEPLWRARYVARLVLHAMAMSVVGVAKGDLRIPFNVLRGGWEGYRGLPAAREASARRMESLG